MITINKDQLLKFSNIERIRLMKYIALGIIRYIDE